MPIGLNKKTSEPEQVDDLTTTKDEVTPKKFDTKLILIIVAVAVVLLIFIMAIMNKNKDSEEDTGEAIQQGTETSTVVYDEDGFAEDSGNSVYNTDGTTKDANGINPGITNYDEATNNQTGATVYSASDFIKDLNGLDVSAVYNVESIDFVEDYVSYETRRAITDEGMEMYWLEADYNGKSYRIQIPFYYYRSLGTSGICKVNVEVLTLVGGGKVVSYMQVIQEED